MDSRTATLHPWNPLHYLFLLDWCFLHPTRLRDYLQRASPGDPWVRGWPGLRHIWTTPAWRNVQVMTLALCGLIIALAVWGAFVSGWLLGLTAIAFLVVCGVLLGQLVGLLYGWTFNAPIGLTLSITFSLSMSVAFSLLSLATMDIVPDEVVLVAAGLGIGLVMCNVFGPSFGVSGGIVICLLGSVSVAAPLAVVADILELPGASLAQYLPALGVPAGLWMASGVLRLPVYALQLPPALLRLLLPARWRGRFHPLLWDDLTVFPLPGAVDFLRRALERGDGRAWEVVAVLLSNPFQRWAVQRAAHAYLSCSADPLALACAWVEQPALAGAALRTPILDPRRLLDVRAIFFAGLAGRFVDGTGGQSETSERFAWQITRPLCARTGAALSGYAGLIHSLLDDEAPVDGSPEVLVDGLAALPHGGEVLRTLETLALFRAWSDPADMARARTYLDWVAALPAAPLRPAVLEALKALGDVGAELAHYREASSRQNQGAALLRATAGLEQLQGYVDARVGPPERALLLAVVRRWQSAVAEVSGQLGEASLRALTPQVRREAGAAGRESAIWRPREPFDNPYRAGAPVFPPLFVGRRDVFDRIGEVWSGQGNLDSIILYGHRRMGKTSILRNLAAFSPPGTVLAYLDLMGGASLARSTDDILLNLADAVYTALVEVLPGAALPEPDPALFGGGRGATHLDRLLARARLALDGRRLILALDEFEEVERAIAEGRTDGNLLRYLRAKVQESWLTLIFGGLHTLDEMSRDYQQPFYGSLVNIKVGVLRPADARELITNPVPGFPLDYAPAAVERIVAESGGQPYLVQQLCRDAVDHLNHQLFDEGREREARIELADVEAVLGETFFTRGTRYFDGVWRQADSPAERAILQIAAAVDGACPAEELSARSRLDEDALASALERLQRHDILCREDGGWRFCVPLMRAWVAAHG